MGSILFNDEYVTGLETTILNHIVIKFATSTRWAVSILQIRTVCRHAKRLFGFRHNKLTCKVCDVACHNVSILWRIESKNKAVLATLLDIEALDNYQFSMYCLTADHPFGLSKFTKRCKEKQVQFYVEALKNPKGSPKFAPHKVKIYENSTVSAWL